MKFENREPMEGLESRRRIVVRGGGNVSDGEFLADIYLEDGAAENPKSELSAENLNNLTVQGKNVEGVINPITGKSGTLQNTVSSIFSFFAQGATAEEFDALNLTAQEYDDMKMTAFDFDAKGKVLLNNKE